VNAFVGNHPVVIPMSSNNASGKVVAVDEQAFEKAGGQAVDEGGFPVVDETPDRGDG